MAGKTKKKKSSNSKPKVVNTKKKRKKSSFPKVVLKGFKYLLIGIGWIFVSLGKLIKKLFSSTLKGAERATHSVNKEIIKREISKITVVKPINGSYQSFWNKLKTSDSLIGIILGARGSGKTAVALSMLENLKGGKKKFFAMGFSKAELPKWIKVVDKVEELDNDSYVVIDEGGILFSSRDSMSSSNKMLSDLLLVARHKNLSILFISQNSSNLEINTLRQADFLVLKKSSLLQKDFERKIVGKIYEKHQEGFKEFSHIMGLALIYSDSFLGFVENDLPSFWSSDVSKGFR